MARRRNEIDDAIEVFVRGFCFGRSLTYPYEHKRIENLWVMRDAPRKNSRDYRKEEWIAYDVEPKQVDSLARKHTRGRYFVCAVFVANETHQHARAEYKRLGYRLLATEGLFVHRLKLIPRRTAAVKIQRVRSPKMAEQFGKATRSRPISAYHLKREAPFRQYVAMEGTAMVGWVSSVDAGKSTWCANLYVKASHRRQGIGSALMTKMLRDDRTRGAKKSVLLASHSGALLYPHLGYEQIGTLLIFAPKKK
jgi:GNAT superfamily N-acetyltransferase